MNLEFFDRENHDLLIRHAFDRENEIPAGNMSIFAKAISDIINEDIFRELNGFDGYTKLFILHDGEFYEATHRPELEIFDAAGARAVEAAWGLMKEK